MKKRIVSLTMVLALCLMLLPASAFAAEDSGAAMYAARKAAVSSRSWTASMNIMTSAGMHRLWKDSPAPMSALSVA